MIVREGLLRHRRRHGFGDALPHGIHLHPPDGLSHAVQISRDKLELCVLERGPAPVDHGHPAVDVGGLVVARDGQDVVRVPRQLARQVRRLDPVSRSTGVLERPDQRRS